MSTTADRQSTKISDMFATPPPPASSTTSGKGAGSSRGNNGSGAASSTNSSSSPFRPLAYVALFMVCLLVLTGTRLPTGFNSGGASFEEEQMQLSVRLSSVKRTAQGLRDYAGTVNEAKAMLKQSAEEEKEAARREAVMGSSSSSLISSDKKGEEKDAAKKNNIADADENKAAQPQRKVAEATPAPTTQQPPQMKATFAAPDLNQLDSPDNKKKNSIDKAPEAAVVGGGPTAPYPTRIPKPTRAPRTNPPEHLPTPSPLEDPLYGYMADFIKPYPPRAVWDAAFHGGRPIPATQYVDLFVDPAEGMQWVPQGDDEKVIMIHENKTLEAMANAKKCSLRPKTEYRKVYEGTTWERTAEDMAEAAGIHQVYGILASPRSLHSRLFVQLNTSLLTAAFVDIFIRKTAVSHAFVTYILAHVRRHHPRPWTVRVVELYGPENAAIHKENHVRNAWMDLELLRFWRAEAGVEAGYYSENNHNKNEEITDFSQIERLRRNASRHIGIAYPAASSESSFRAGTDAIPTATADLDAESENNGIAPPRMLSRLHHTVDWYAIIDDDGYVFLDSVKMLLLDVKRGVRRENKKNMENASYVDPALIVGFTMPSHMARAAMIGGSGFHFNRRTLMGLTVAKMDFCFKRYSLGQGDVTGSFCLADAGGRMVHAPHTFHTNVDESVDSGMPRQSPYPVGTHRYYGAKILYRLHEMEMLRRSRGELVSWEDFIYNISPNGDLILLERFDKCFHPHDVEREGVVYNFPMKKRMK